MRILHTSDWHVGKQLRGRSRADEHAGVLDEIAAIAAAQAVDLVLVAGDLFDTAAPPPEAERIVHAALLALADTGATVVAVAGNHDNPRRLEAVAPLYERLGRVVVRCAVRRPDEGGTLAVETRAGEQARIALLPFLSQRHVVRAHHLMSDDADEHAQRYADRVRRVLAALATSFSPDAVNLVLAHATVTGGALGGGERSAHTIFDYHVEPTAFPADAHYVALGHLHRAQRIPGPCPVWYSGSPLHLDFGEVSEGKCVLVVDAAPGVPARVERVPLESGRRLRTLRGTLAELEALAGTTGDAYLRVYVRSQARAGLGDAVRELFPQAVDVVVDEPDRHTRSPAAFAERAAREPSELFAEYLEGRAASDERVLALFRRLHEECDAPD